MKLNSAQVEQTLTQFEAHVIPENHPLVPKLNELFGDQRAPNRDGSGADQVRCRVRRCRRRRGQRARNSVAHCLDGVVLRPAGYRADGGGVVAMVIQSRQAF